MDLTLTFLDLHIQKSDKFYRYSLHFQLAATGKTYSELGTAPTPMQCTEMAMIYIAQVVQESAVAG